MSLAVPPDYVENLNKRSEMTRKGILPPPLKMILKTPYPLPVHQQPPPTSPPLEIPPSPSPLPCAEPESFRNDQIEKKENYLEALVAQVV